MGCEIPHCFVGGSLAERDWQGFTRLTGKLGEKIEVVGDDLFVTNTRYIARGIKERAANAALIKLNQIGTVTESIDSGSHVPGCGMALFFEPPFGRKRKTRFWPILPWPWMGGTSRPGPPVEANGWPIQPTP